MSEQTPIPGHDCLKPLLKEIEQETRLGALSLTDLARLATYGAAAGLDVAGKCPGSYCGISFSTENGGRKLHIRDALAEAALSAGIPTYKPDVPDDAFAFENSPEIPPWRRVEQSPQIY